MRPLERQPLEGGAGGAVHPAVQMDVGDAGDGEAVELVREVGNGDVEPRDGDGRRLDEKPVAQRGGAEGAGSSDEKAAAGEGERHGGKGNAPPIPLFQPHPLSPSPRSWRGGTISPFRNGKTVPRD